MKYLLYGIMGTPEGAGPEPPAGVGGQPVVLVDRNGLSAAVSVVDSVPAAPGLSWLLAYGGVVDALHCRHTVIPIRYGCFLEQQEGVARLIEERRAHYEALLNELDGCTEMGIRVILPAMAPGQRAGTGIGAAGPPGGLGQPDPAVGSAMPGSPSPDAPNPHAGRAYLAALKARHAATERVAALEGEIAARIAAPLSGLFTSTRVESSRGGGNGLLSLYYLVPRGSVDAFRGAFRQISRHEPVRLLLSGPWPPYNFVLPAPRHPPG